MSTDMQQLQNEQGTDAHFDELTKRLREKVNRGEYIAEDLDEYIAASKPYMDRLLTKEEFHAGMDIIQARLDKLTAMMAQAVKSISAAHQQHMEASHPEG